MFPNRHFALTLTVLLVPSVSVMVSVPTRADFTCGEGTPVGLQLTPLEPPHIVEADTTVKALLVFVRFQNEDPDEGPYSECYTSDWWLTSPADTLLPWATKMLEPMADVEVGSTTPGTLGDYFYVFSGGAHRLGGAVYNAISADLDSTLYVTQHPYSYYGINPDEYQYDAVNEEVLDSLAKDTSIDFSGPRATTTSSSFCTTSTMCAAFRIHWIGPRARHGTSTGLLVVPISSSGGQTDRLSM